MTKMGPQRKVSFPEPLDEVIQKEAEKRSLKVTQYVRMVMQAHESSKVGL